MTETLPMWAIIHQCCFDQFAKVLPSAKREWLSAARASRFAVDLEEKLRAVEQPHEEEIGWAIAEWSRAGAWPAVSENARFALRLRFETAADFAYQHTLLSGKTFFPAPGLPVREICSWLVTEWWEDHGRFDCASAFCTEFEPDPPAEE